MGSAARETLGSFSDYRAMMDERGSRAPPLDEWVSRHRVIIGGAHPGRWDWENARASLEPMRAFSDREVRRLVVVAPTQLMKSELAVSCAVYEAHHGSDVLFYEPDDALLRAFIGDRIRPALRSLGVVEVESTERQHLKRRDSAIAVRLSGGGLITGVTPQHRTGSAGRTARTVILDERDLMGSGDMEQVALSRTTTYGQDARIVILGTPTVDEPGTVWRAWREGSRGEWHGTCPHCGELSRVRWAQVHFDRGPKREWIVAGSHLRCSECGEPWTEGQRLAALDRGAYVHEDPASPFRSYWVPGPAHIWRSVEQIVAAGAEAYEVGASDHEWGPYQRWTNEFRAEVWEDEYRGLSPGALGRQRWDPGARGGDDWGELHPETLLLTWGADVGAASVHAEWVAWGWDPDTDRVRTWGARYAVVGGRPEDSVDDGELWSAVRDAVLSTRFRLAGAPGLVGVQKGLIDCRWSTPIVRAWCEEMAREERVRVRPGPGKWRHFSPTILPYMSKAIESGYVVDLRSGVGSVEKRKRLPAIVFANSGILKAEQFESWSLDQRSAVRANVLPADAETRGYDDAWRSEIAAELPVVVRSKRGEVTRQWERKRGHGRNEAWDARTYARAAAYVLAYPLPLAEYLRRLHERRARSGKIVPIRRDT